MAVTGVTKGGDSQGISAAQQRVFDLVATGNFTPRKISQLLKLSRKTIYKHIRNLKAKNLLDKNLQVTRDGLQLLGLSKSHKKQYRINGVQIMYDLPKSLDKNKWKQNRGRVLSLRKISHSKITLRNKSGITDEAPRFFINDKFECRAHANGVMVYLPDIFAATGTDAELIMLKLIEDIGLELNRIFKVAFFRENTLSVRILKYELAHLNDAVAKELRKDGKKMYISLDGQLRYIVDFSKHIDEGEAVTVDNGLVDSNIFHRIYKESMQLEEEEKLIYPKDLREILEKQIAVNKIHDTFYNNLAPYMGEYNKNIQLHMNVMKDIRAAVKDLVIAVKQQKHEPHIFKDLENEQESEGK
ncbi:MAG: hypothetical protein EPO20_30555 [Betaproteobacteria bacterium]|nr:MAG: hypothetical protein EPO20_30555 [Betaproteobacteria bacterium]